MELKEWKEKNAKPKSYAHFDERVSLDKAWDYISNPSNIARHGFYPFIHFEDTARKYKHKTRRLKIKKRQLCYSAHIDRYIYSYYGYLLNRKYNEYLEARGLGEVAVAYRDNLHKNNIHLAKQAFDRIKDLGSCFVVIGDFTDFFDRLNHGYLKRRMCDVMGVSSLPPDYYAVFKNITKYSMWELEDIIKFRDERDEEKNLLELEAQRGLLTDDEYMMRRWQILWQKGAVTAYKLRKLNKERKVLSEQEFRDNKKNCIVRNPNHYGIPQGSSISAILANVYMIHADEQIGQIASERNGMYMRYSDDFIVILPEMPDETFRETLDKITYVIKSVPKLTLSPEKTQVFQYQDQKVISRNADFLKDKDGKEIANGKNEMDYLGFTFDGKEVTIRDKTVSKYYYRMYRKLKTIVNSKYFGRPGYTRLGHKINCKVLYAHYSERGARSKDENGRIKGNFITYVQNAQRIFGKDEPIDRKTRRHMAKIRRVLKEVFPKKASPKKASP